MNHIHQTDFTNPLVSMCFPWGQESINGCSKAVFKNRLNFDSRYREQIPIRVYPGISSVRLVFKNKLSPEIEDYLIEQHGSINILLMKNNSETLLFKNSMLDKYSIGSESVYTFAVIEWMRL